MIEFLAQVNNNLTNLPETSAGPGRLKTILAVAFGIAAAIALLSIAIAAFNFVTSEGDPEKISRSKRAIVYALVGLAVALLGEAIVFLVVGQL